jgi:hypothetical protein
VVAAVKAAAAAADDDDGCEAGVQARPFRRPSMADFNARFCRSLTPLDER